MVKCGIYFISGTHNDTSQLNMFFGVNEIPPKRLGLTGAIELYPVITEIFPKQQFGHIIRRSSHLQLPQGTGTEPILEEPDLKSQKAMSWLMCGVALAFPLQTRSIRMMNCARRTPPSSVSIKIQR